MHEFKNKDFRKPQLNYAKFNNMVQHFTIVHQHICLVPVTCDMLRDISLTDTSHSW